jgi:hypothetical protein
VTHTWLEVGEHQPAGPQSASTRQLPSTQWLPSPPVYGDPWQAHVWPVGHSLSSAHVSQVQEQAGPGPGPLHMQRPFGPASAHCESVLHNWVPTPKLHVPLGAGPRHCESFGRWFTGGPPSLDAPLDEPLPELLLDPPELLLDDPLDELLDDPLPELLLDAPLEDPLLDTPLDDPLPLLDPPLEETLPPELLPVAPELLPEALAPEGLPLEPVLSPPASLPTAAV